MFVIRPDVMKIFYKGYINEEENYFMVKWQKLDFGPNAINGLFGLEANELGHTIFKNLQEQDLEDASITVAWSGIKWDITPTGKYQLFPHKLNTEANILVVFVKKKIMPTLHNNTCLTLDKLPQVDVKDRVYSSSILHHIISISKNRAKLKCLKTKQDGKSEAEEVDDEDEI
ncbi:hypothetical protein E5676_scaffold419G00400 [Cucumis melo var. makuwa]|uniref:Uncharacterized protein n=1 Tax=Cucumis melo var. makuwa TaxID=1194695 RepID=A0A5D3DJM3_CUCMM|nr:hypothetical protein E5676_scaffold419G00400 [Cucumis melo var. makuwa]